MLSYINKKFGWESDAEKIRQMTTEFMSKKTLLTVEAFNRAMATSALDDGLTPTENYMDSLLGFGGCYEDQNLFDRQTEEFQKTLRETKGLEELYFKMVREVDELEKEIEMYQLIIKRRNAI
jgi:hypothetical protein